MQNKSKACELGFLTGPHKKHWAPEQRKGGRQSLEEERDEGRKRVATEEPQKLRAGPDREEQVE